MPVLFKLPMAAIFRQVTSIEYVYLQATSIEYVTCKLDSQSVGTDKTALVHRVSKAGFLPTVQFQFVIALLLIASVSLLLITCSLCATAHNAL